MRAGAGGGADCEPAVELAALLARELVHELPLRLQDALGASVENAAGIGRHDAAAGPVEQALAEPGLERPNLEADGRLSDPEPLGGLREAPAFDDGAEGGKLSRIHKQSLWSRSLREGSVNRAPLRSAAR